MTNHTAKAFDVDLHELRRKVGEMGGLAERQVATSVDALAHCDVNLAQRVIFLDDLIDGLQREIEEISVITIARRQPMAIDLREIVGALRIANDLERIGDLAKNIGKRVLALHGEILPPQAVRGVRHMADLVLTQLKEVLDSYARRDVEKALMVWRSDEAVDAVNNSLFGEVFTYMMADPHNITLCIHLLFCAKNIEREGDHATNIAETVHYIVEGCTLADARPKADRTSLATAPVATSKTLPIDSSRHLLEPIVEMSNNL
jgi:phosphate transport system protein